jgi:hypothetical protein
VYVGESIHAVTRMNQHLARRERDHLDTVRVVIDPTFNKSVCLDLESFLIESVLALVTFSECVSPKLVALTCPDCGHLWRPDHPIGMGRLNAS